MIIRLPGMAVIGLLALAGCQGVPFQKTASKSDDFKLSELPESRPKNYSSSLAEAKYDDDAPELDARNQGDMSSTVAKLPEDRTSRSLSETLNRGLTLEQQDKLDEAKQAYRRVLTEDPKHTVAHHRMAVIADQDQNFEEAEKHYRAALRGKPDDPNVLSDLGFSYLLQGRYAESEEKLQAALDQQSTHKQALKNLGLLYGKQGDYDRALATFRRAGKEGEAQADIAKLFPNGRPGGEGLARRDSLPEIHASPRGRGARSESFAETGVPQDNDVAGIDPGASFDEVRRRMDEQKHIAQQQRAEQMRAEQAEEQRRMASLYNEPQDPRGQAPQGPAYGAPPYGNPPAQIGPAQRPSYTASAQPNHFADAGSAQPLSPEYRGQPQYPVTQAAGASPYGAIPNNSNAGFTANAPSGGAGAWPYAQQPAAAAPNTPARPTWGNQPAPTANGANPLDTLDVWPPVGTPQAQTQPQSNNAQFATAAGQQGQVGQQPGVQQFGAGIDPSQFGTFGRGAGPQPGAAAGPSGYAYGSSVANSPNGANVNDPHRAAAIVGMTAGPGAMFPEMAGNGGAAGANPNAPLGASPWPSANYGDDVNPSQFPSAETWPTGSQQANFETNAQPGGEYPSANLPGAGNYNGANGSADVFRQTIERNQAEINAIRRQLQAEAQTTGAQYATPSNPNTPAQPNYGGANYPSANYGGGSLPATRYGAAAATPQYGSANYQ